MKKALSSTAAAAGILTLMSFALRGLGMVFRVYLSGRLGSAGLGLYQLIMSVYATFATFATAGFSASVSRLAAEKLEDADEKRGKSGALRVLLVSSLLAFCMGAAAGTVLYGGARFFAERFVMDFRASAPLRILALSMPFMSLSACLKGYFTAVGQIYKPSVASVFEQCAKIGITLCVFETVCKGVTSSAALCTAVVAGLSAGEVLSYAFLAVLYLFFSKRQKEKVRPADRFSKTLSSVFSVTAPISACAYVTNVLHSVESVLIPMQFVRFGDGRVQALSAFGTIRGMTIPMLFFPYAFLGALLSIQIPAISRLNTSQNKSQRNALIERVMKLSAVFSAVTGVVFFVFAKEFSVALYGSEECVQSTRILSLVTPFMYMETMSDGLLKSIGQQNRTLLYSVVNSVFRIAMVLFFIPYSGDVGYLWLLVVSNTLSFVLCFFRLKKVSGFKLGLGNYAMKPLAFALLGALAASPIRRFNINASVAALLCCGVCVGVFLVFYLPVWKKHNA